MPVNITEEFVRYLMEQNVFLSDQVAEFTATVDNMNQTITELNQTIRELKEQLNKNSKNSSRLPSSDGLKKPTDPLHGGVKTGSFPEDIKATVQYGKNLQAMVVAFNTVGTVSINRTHKILSSVFNIPLATGNIKNMVTRCAESLKDTYERIRLTMISLGLLHCDETGSRIDGKTGISYIMSYIGSARKQGINAFTTICEALNGNPDIIFS